MAYKTEKKNKEKDLIKTLSNYLKSKRVYEEMYLMVSLKNKKNK